MTRHIKSGKEKLLAKATRCAVQVETIGWTNTIILLLQNQSNSSFRLIVLDNMTFGKPERVLDTPLTWKSEVSHFGQYNTILVTSVDNSNQLRIYFESFTECGVFFKFLTEAVTKLQELRPQPLSGCPSFGGFGSRKLLFGVDSSTASWYGAFGAAKSFGGFGSTPATTNSFGGGLGSAKAFGGGFGSTTTSTTNSFGGGFGSARSFGGGFGSFPATTNSFGGGFGSTHATTNSFGGGFGSTPATTNSFGGGFGSTPATTNSFGGGFGSTPATTNSTSYGGFGSTPAQANPYGSGFGTPAQTSFGGGFGSTPAKANPYGGFGSTPQQTSYGGGFGSTPAQQTSYGGGFGSTPATTGTFGFVSATKNSFGTSPAVQSSFGNRTATAASMLTLDQEILDPKSKTPMIDAVTLIPCGHSVSEQTANSLFWTSRPTCPVCFQVANSTVVNHALRRIATLTSAVPTAAGTTATQAEATVATPAAGTTATVATPAARTTATQAEATVATPAAASATTTIVAPAAAPVATPAEQHQQAALTLKFVPTAPEKNPEIEVKEASKLADEELFEAGKFFFAACRLQEAKIAFSSCLSGVKSEEAKAYLALISYFDVFSRLKLAIN